LAEEGLGKECGGSLEGIEVIALEQVGVGEAPAGEAAAEEFSGAGGRCAFCVHGGAFPTGRVGVSQGQWLGREGVGGRRVEGDGWAFEPAGNGIAPLQPDTPIRLEIGRGQSEAVGGPIAIDGIELGAGSFAIAPFEEGFGEGESVAGVGGSQFHTSFEVSSGLGAVADAGGPPRSLQVKQPQSAIGTGVVDGGVCGKGGEEGGLDAGDDPEGTEGLGLGELAEVQGEEIVGLRAIGIEGESGVAGVDAGLCEAGAIPVAGLGIGPVEGGAGEAPGEFNGVGSLEAGLFGEMEGVLEAGALGLGVVGSSELWEGRGDAEQPCEPNQGWEGEMASFHLRFQRREHYTVLRLSK
jgi:hypothetical protein